MIVQGLTTSFKEEILLGVHNLVVDQIRMALYTAPANLTAETTAYTASSEVVGVGYVAGGKVCQNVTVLTSGTASNGTAFVSFDAVEWSPAVFTCRTALIYNASKANRAIAVLNFGADKTAIATFVVTLPANTADSALIRLP
jgi:hypothetical protein